MTTWRVRAKLANAVVAAFFVLGIAIALLGIGIDLLPGSTSGINLPQLLMITGGLFLAVLAMVLRRVDARRRVWLLFRGNLLAVLAISGLTLIVLEFVLAAVQLPTYFPAEIPPSDFEQAPWWTCDLAGCHFIFDEAEKACEDGILSNRDCLVNRQGFGDSQDFVAHDDLDDKLRILALGDSFTFGWSADLGHSYVETVEKILNHIEVWNVGIPGAGHHHALASLREYAPVMQPQLVILGFSMNDFEDNLLPMDAWLRTIASDKMYHLIRQYKFDQWGNVIKLELKTFDYYRQVFAFPPANEFEHLLGKTRLGSLLLRFRDISAELLVDRILTEKQLAVTRDYLSILRDEVAALDAQLLVLLIPEEWDLDVASERYQSAIRLLKEQRIAFLDVIDLLELDTHYAEGSDTHWNTEGHQKIGALLGSCLQAFLVDETFANCENVVLP